MELFSDINGKLVPNDLLAGRIERDKGIKIVSDNNETWMEKAFRAACLYISGTEKDFTGEDLRFHCEPLIGPPKHPNAWGALSNSLVKRNFMHATGEYRQPRDKSSHARRIQVYEKTLALGRNS